ncbi:MAG TPA: RecX family transcriptional regulator [Gaiellaceae bacterium]
MKRKQPQPSEPIDVAARALRHRDRSRQQVDERLARAGVGDDQRAAALAALERIGYVDDARFAGQRAASLADRGYGDEAIRALLAADGVAPDVVGEAVGALRPEAERAAEIVASLGASPRTAARLARKGFGEDTVEAAAGSFAAGGSEA